MNNFFKKVKQNCISGILFLLPVLILLIIVQKVFVVFAKFGGGIAKVIGLDKIMGQHAANFIGALVLLGFVYVCGYLVRLAFFKKISDGIDAKLKEIIPGYEKHKEKAKNQLVEEHKVDTDLPVLIQFGKFWQPGFLIEQDNIGNAVVKVSTSDSHNIYILPLSKVKLLKETTLVELKTSIASSGKGLLGFK